MKNQEDINFAAAQAAFNVQANHVTNMWNGVFNFSNEAIKTAVLLNGGAAVACLTYLASVHSSSEFMAAERSNVIGYAVGDFMIGGLMAGLCACLCYFAHYCYAQANVCVTQSYIHPFIKRNGATTLLDIGGTLVHLIAIGVLGLSYVKLMDGIVSAAPRFGFPLRSKTDLITHVWSSLFS